MHALPESGFDSVVPLFGSYEFHVTCNATLSGVCPGQCFVDDPDQPGSAVLLSPEALYVGGKPDSTFCRSFIDWLCDSDARGRPSRSFDVLLNNDAWLEQLSAMGGSVEVRKTPRRHYTCDSPVDSLAVPDGTVVTPIDADFLNSSLDIPEHIPRWIDSNWRSPAAFDKLGFGVASVWDGRVASWSVADCAFASQCEIGIRTAQEHRGRGFGAFTAAAAVKHALTNKGFSVVGWHCPEENVGSQRTAEKAGFKLERQYSTYTICEREDASAE